MNSDNLGGFALAGISCRSLGSVPCIMVIITRREAANAEVEQTGLAIIVRCLIHFLLKTRRTSPLCGDDGLRILLG